MSWRSVNPTNEKIAFIGDYLENYVSLHLKVDRSIV
jgi:hypothetical protein